MMSNNFHIGTTKIEYDLIYTNRKKTMELVLDINNGFTVRVPKEMEGWKYKPLFDFVDLSKEGAKKTSILYQGNLSYTQIQSYLPFLIKKEILEECIIKKKGKDRKYYRTTSKGLSFLEAAQRTSHYLK